MNKSNEGVRPHQLEPRLCVGVLCPRRHADMVLVDDSSHASVLDQVLVQGVYGGDLFNKSWTRSFIMEMCVKCFKDVLTMPYKSRLVSMKAVDGLGLVLFADFDLDPSFIESHTFTRGYEIVP